MLGRPKYQVGDKVSFEMSYDNKKFNLEGVIEIVDAFGTYFYKDGPSYDIMMNYPPLNQRFRGGFSKKDGDSRLPLSSFTRSTFTCFYRKYFNVVKFNIKTFSCKFTKYVCRSV